MTKRANRRAAGWEGITGAGRADYHHAFRWAGRGWLPGRVFPPGLVSSGPVFQHGRSGAGTALGTPELRRRGEELRASQPANCRLSNSASAHANGGVQAGARF